MYHRKIFIETIRESFNKDIFLQIKSKECYLPFIDREKKFINNLSEKQKEEYLVLKDLFYQYQYTRDLEIIDYIFSFDKYIKKLKP